MEKSKLGLNVGVVGALAYLSCWLGGFTASLLIVGYVLLFEPNGWLRRTVIKALTVSILFSLLGIAIGVIPDVFRLVGSLFSVFNANMYPDFLYNLESFLIRALNLTEMVLTLLLAFKALKQRTIVISFVDKLISQFVN